MTVGVKIMSEAGRKILYNVKKSESEDEEQDAARLDAAKRF